MRAYRIHEEGKFGRGRFDTMAIEGLDAGDVVVKVAYASVNYKDALTARGRARIATKFPVVAGNDFSGIVESSADPRFRKGDAVTVQSHGLGGRHDGGYAEYARVPAEWLIHLPEGMSLFEASALGVAGNTAAWAIELMELNGLTPAMGKVLVNGATGGVASIGIDILAQRGYHVVAMTGKADQAEFLKGLGAAEVVARPAVPEKERPLESPLYAGALDSVGGPLLAWTLRRMDRDGVVAAFGNASGTAFPGDVLPFILRGVRLLGVNVNNPQPVMERVWRRLATDYRPRHLERIAHRIRFDELDRAFDDLLEARMTGRYVVDFSL